MSSRGRKGILHPNALGSRPFESESKAGSLSVYLMPIGIYQFTLATVHILLSFSWERFLPALVCKWLGFEELDGRFGVLPYARITWVVAVV